MKKHPDDMIYQCFVLQLFPVCVKKVNFAFCLVIRPAIYYVPGIPRDQIHSLHEFNLAAPTGNENYYFHPWTPRTLLKSVSPGQNGASER
jgi:hypothetical protein